MKSGRLNFSPSETGAGQKPANVRHVLIIRTARGMDFITGMATGTTFLYATMQKFCLLLNSTTINGSHNII